MEASEGVLVKKLVSNNALMPFFPRKVHLIPEQTQFSFFLFNMGVIPDNNN